METMGYYQIFEVFKCSDCGYAGQSSEWMQSISDELCSNWISIRFVTLCPICKSACYDVVENPIIDL